MPETSQVLGSGVWIGLDVGADSLNVCVLDHSGAPLIEQAMAACPNEVSAFLEEHSDKSQAIIGTESTSVAIHLTRTLRAQGFDVRVFDSRQVSKFLGIRQNKTDHNDARGIADIVRLGTGVVAEVRIKSAECQKLRSQLVLRQKLVQHRMAAEGAIRAVFRLNGGKLVRSHSAVDLRRKVVDEAERIEALGGVSLLDEIEPVLAIGEATRRYLEKCDRRLMKLADANDVCRALMGIPGVGPITALSFYTAIEDPHRFRRSEDVGAYLGLAPLTKQSGTMLSRRGISKRGNPMTRKHLVIAAMALLRIPTDCALKAWAVDLGKRVGKRRALVALARKLATVMLAIWKTGKPYEPQGAYPSRAPVRGMANGRLCDKPGI